MVRERVAVIFHRFGPYHIARLAAAAEGFDLLAVEEAAESSEYAWDAIGKTDGFRRATLLARGERLERPAREIVRRLTDLLERERPAAVVVPGWIDPAALAGLRWGLKNRVPTVVMSESTAFDEPRRAWKEWIKGRIVRLCAAGLVGGEPHAAYLAALGLPRERIFPGYDAVDNDHFAAGADAARADAVGTRARLGLSFAAPYFLASSRFVPQKNLSSLLTAYAAYRRQAGIDAWKLVLLGDGPLRLALTAQLAALDVTADVFLPGFKQYAELPAYYGLAGAFVHASTSEPWGLVVNEAMAAGLPVLVSEHCGCAHDLVAEGETGWTFPPTDLAVLSALLARVAACGADGLTALGAASRRRIEDWSPRTFAVNLKRAVHTARAHPPRGLGVFDRLLFAVLLCKAEGTARRLLPSAPGTTAPVGSSATPSRP